VHHYDLAYALGWGRDLLHGDVPDFEAPGASTPHPLTIAFGMIVSPLGADGSLIAARVAILAALTAIVLGAFLLGRACFGTPAGVVAAVAVASSPAFIGFALTGAADAPFLALVLVAAALEAERPRRGRPVLLLLAVAGLLRPEAWLLAAAYWIYLAPRASGRQRLLLAVPVALAPALWALMDLLITGDPLWSLSSTREGAVRAGRLTGLGNVPSFVVDGLQEILRKPEAAGGAAGLAIVALRPTRARLIPPVLVALALAGVVALGLAELPLRERYLYVIPAALIVLAGYAATGWLKEPKGRRRRVWIGGAVVLLALALQTAPSQVDQLRFHADITASRHAAYQTLLDLTQDEGRRLRACPVFVAGFSITPLLALYLEAEPRDVEPLGTGPPARGAVVIPASGDVAERFELPAGDQRDRRTRPPANMPLVASNEGWNLYARGC
jgi:hypothetical protein